MKKIKKQFMLVLTLGVSLVGFIHQNDLSAVRRGPEYQRRVVVHRRRVPHRKIQRGRFFKIMSNLVKEVKKLKAQVDSNKQDLKLTQQALGGLTNNIRELNKKMAAQEKKE